MKFKLGLTMSLCVALGAANVAVYADEGNVQLKKLPDTTAVRDAGVGEADEVPEGTTEEATEGATEEATEGTTEEATEGATEEVAEDTTGDVTEDTTQEVPEGEVVEGEVVEGEIVVIPEEEVPLAEEMPILEVVQEDATLTIVHKLQFDIGEAVQEQIVVGLKAGETINLADYACTNDEVVLSGEIGSVVLVAGENSAEIQYELIYNAANIDGDALEEGDC
ncbi:hypothetical protein [Anaerotignum sp.]|uniref:hypothetical protein n=1 Tax=Anaerotignum sp. TaxID=2039241 RepID=UPI003317FE30